MRPASKPSGQPYELWADTFDDVWNGPEIRTIRLRMLAGDEVNLCHKCYEEEANGSRSLRVDHNEAWIGTLGTELDQRIAEAGKNDGQVSAPPLWLELKLGNRCNLRCRMCCPEDSDQIQAEYDQLGRSDPFFEQLWGHQRNPGGHLPLAEMSEWYSSRFLWDQVDARLPGLLKINLVGGEPTMIEEIYDFMEKAVATGHAGHLELQFNTNLTSLRPRFLELLPHFRYVRFVASIDGVGALQEYIRHPSRWESIQRNFQTALANLAPNTQLFVAPTIQIYNVLQITDLFRWVESAHEWHHPPITPALLDGPWYLNVRFLPFAVRDLAAQRIEAYLAEGDLPRRFQWFRERLGVFTNLLRSEPPLHQAGRDDLLETFLRFSTILDATRGEHLADAAPELCKLLMEHAPVAWARAAQREPPARPA
jgi:hypothetical protein